ncbi:MAG: hypothetical protein AAGA23_08325 [Pseudomonadota bacterium]
MRQLLALLLGLLFFFAGTLVRANDLAGVWEIRFQDAVGQHYLDVFELREDGHYVTHMQSNVPSDRGTYRHQNNVLSLTSRISPQFSRDIPYSLKGGVLSLHFAQPGRDPLIANWQRSTLTRRLPTQVFADRRVPTQLVSTLTDLAEGVRRWQPDAVPTAIRISRLSQGEFETAMHFYSAQAGRELRLRVSAFDVKVSEHGGRQLLMRPLPPGLLDLAAVLPRVYSDSAAAPLRKADLRDWAKAGPVWRVTLEKGKGMAFSGITGERISGDVTGYVERYEADWNYAGELWRQAIEAMMPESDGDGKWPDCDHDLISDCELAFCYWKEPQNKLNKGYCSDYPS